MKVISQFELSQLRSQGFVVCRGAFSDLQQEVVRYTSDLLSQIRNSSVDWDSALKAAGRNSDLTRDTGERNRIRVGDFLAVPEAARWTMDWSGEGITDISISAEDRTSEPEFSPVKQLLWRVDEFLEPLQLEGSFGVQLRHIPPETSLPPDRNALAERVLQGFHVDGGNTFAKTQNVNLLPLSRFLIGMYLTDMDADYFERPCGQLMVIPNGHRQVCEFYSRFLEAFAKEQTPTGRANCYRTFVSGAVKEYAARERENWMTVQVKPGDILVAHALLPHSSGQVWLPAKTHVPPGRPAMYYRTGNLPIEHRGKSALTDPDFVWKV